MTEPGRDELAAVRRLAYDESRERLASQQRDLDQFKTRVSAALTVATAAAALLAGAAFAGSGEDRFSTDWRLWLALAFLAGVALVNLYVLWPRMYRFHLDAAVVLSDYADAGRSLDETHKWIAWYNARNADANERYLASFAWALALAGGLVVGEVGLLTWFLVSNA